MTQNTNFSEFLKLTNQPETSTLRELPSDSGNDFRVCGPINEHGGILQIIKCPNDYLSGVSILFGTYCRPQEFAILVELYAIDGELSEYFEMSMQWPEPISSCVIQAGSLIDNEYYHIYLNNIENSKGRLFAIKLTAVEAEGKGEIAPYVSSGEERISGHCALYSNEGLFEAHGLKANLIYSSPVVQTNCPPGMLYSPLTSCNMNCTHCISRHSRKRVVRMSAAIKDEISQLALAGRLKWMYTDYSGDILFADHKNPGELEYVVGLGIAVHIDTNGAYLTDERIKTIIESKFDAVSISIDAATNSIYQTIRIGAPHIDEIFDAILRLVAARKRGGRLKNLTISAGFTLMRSNIHELPLFVARAAQIGVDSIGCRHLEVYHSPMREESLFHDPHRFNLARGKALAVAASLGIQLNIGAELQSQSGTGSLQPCMLPWESVTVLGNGDVMACCVPGSKIGSTSDSTLEDIWNGERYRRLRQRVNSNNPPAICGSCQFRNAVNRFGEHNIFSRESTSDLCFEDEL